MSVEDRQKLLTSFIDNITNHIEWKSVVPRLGKNTDFVFQGMCSSMNVSFGLNESTTCAFSTYDVQ